MTVQDSAAEPIIEPSLPIIDPHHHLWVMTEADLKARESIGPVHKVMQRNVRYLLEEFLAHANTGHNIIATVFAECGTMYRANGPEELKSLGEVEFANGMAAMAASGTFGPTKVCAGIIGHPNLMLGDAVEDVLHAHIRAGGERYRGIRAYVVTEEEAKKSHEDGRPRPTFNNPDFRAGFKLLRKLGLSFDLMVLEPTLSQCVGFARDFSDTQIILDHGGIPIGHVTNQKIDPERFNAWRSNIRAIAECENVTMKIGGLGMPNIGFKSFMVTPPVPSTQLAQEWKPYIETCIEAFGADRCMFESNFPIDSGCCTYAVLWNTFKRVVGSASQCEKTALFSGTAKKVYHLDV